MLIGKATNPTLLVTLTGKVERGICEGDQPDILRWYTPYPHFDVDTFSLLNALIALGDQVWLFGLVLACYDAVACC